MAKRFINIPDPPLYDIDNYIREEDLYISIWKTYCTQSIFKPNCKVCTVVAHAYRMHIHISDYARARNIQRLNVLTATSYKHH